MKAFMDKDIRDITETFSRVRRKYADRRLSLPY